MKKILKTYLNRLTNLSGNNRSLLLLRLTDQFLDLHDLDFQFKKPSFSIVEDLIARKPGIKLLENINSRDDQSNELSNRIKKIYRHDKFITEERGAKDLYVGWPFVKGKLMDETSVRAPLLFFPVELVLEDKTWVLSLRKDENIVLNKSFLLAYSHYNSQNISEEIIDKQFDDWSKTSQVFRTDLYSLIKESNLSINFNQELFIDKLCSFHQYKKDEFDLKYKTGELKLFPEAILGIFPQAGSYLVPDYNYLLGNDQIVDLESLFIKRTAENHGNQKYSIDRFNYLNKVKEEHTFTPFPIDASQENSIKAVKLGNSIVVQGPPGSGKSQLICNLIADHIARGKRVLMVCQKRVALDVVHQRLKNEGIGDFVALVHDFKNDRKEIYSQIQSQIEQLSEFQNKNSTLDTIYLERSFIQASRKIDQISEELASFKIALFDTEECGVSIKELYLTSDKTLPLIELKNEYKSFSFDKIEGFLNTLKYYLSYSELFESDDFVWKDRVSFASYTFTDLNTLKSNLEGIPVFINEYIDRLNAVSSKVLAFGIAEEIVSRRSSVEDFNKSLQEDGVFEIFKTLQNVEIENDNWLESIEKRVLDSFDDLGVELTLKKDQLGVFQEALVKAENAAHSTIDWLRWSLFSKDKHQIKQVLTDNNLILNKKGINQLTRKLNNRLNLEHNLSELRGREWITLFPTDHQKITYKDWFHKYKRAFQLKKKFSSISDFISIDFKTIQLPEFKRRLSELLELGDLFLIRKKEWLKIFHGKQLEKLLLKPSYASELITALELHFDALCEYDQIFKEFHPAESTVVKKLLEYRIDNSPEDLLSLFQNSLKITWIEHIEQLFPILRSVSTLRLRQLEEELQMLVQEKFRLSKDILLLKLREKTYANIEVNRLNNSITYRDLLHQVNKKRMIWPIRKLIATHADEIFNLVPCWMASPESVSSIFPMEEYFDLVIFDEASQCYAENGIPSIFRGKQVVITGDSKQLNPNDIYKSRWEEQDDELPETQIDSLLDLGSRYLMQTQLTGHYRSETLELIDFSNYYFYKGKLSLMPQFEDVSQSKQSIEYIKVDGTWEKNTNEAEAYRVAKLVFELIKNGVTEIGIVTFNFSQQVLIQNILDIESSVRKIDVPNTLFVKNIENVQGDERDVIIFSIAYAPDIKGKLSMNFGSLNANGGENRLNVAITRAKKKIIIVTSIYPHQLKVDDLKHDGPRFFKKYLEYAMDVSEGRFVHQRKAEVQLPFEGILKHKLVGLLPVRGEKVSKNLLPFSDLVITEDNKYKGLILTDDELYYQGISIKDSHVYKKLTLRRKGWKFTEFYSREYWYDKENLKNNFLSFLSSIK